MSDELTVWRLDFGSDPFKHTLVFASIDHDLPTVAYNGSYLPDNTRLKDIAQHAVRPLTPGTLDQLAPLSILPEEGQGFQGYCGLHVSDSDARPALTQFRIDSVNESPGEIVFHASDAICGLGVSLHFSCEENSNVLQTHTQLHNTANTRWRVDWLSVPVLQLDQSFSVLQEYRGRWTQEFSPVHTDITTGVRSRESRKARTGHDHFPALIAGCAPLAWTYGASAAVHFDYSDVHRTVLESLPDGRRQVQAGIAETRWLEPHTSLSSGNAFWAFSQHGLNDVAHHYQSFVRRHIVDLPNPAAPRYVNYNCWEAIYFDHNIERLKTLATSAAQVGAERFVLDDGWFGTDALPRNDDTSTLGDWFVDTNKYPDGLTPLVEHVNSLGMRFGIWLEPEMVNLNSQLAKQHPDWVLKHGPAKHIEGRQQYLLDLSNPLVTNYLFECIDKLLSAHNIEYIKWDMNRDATRAVDSDGHRSLVRHSDAVNALMAKIRQAHPSVEIESCASGGGRIDYRVLKNTHRVWLSDSIDARVRWKMQSEAFLFLPASVYGSHVGAEKVHTSARKQPMSFRAAVAMSAHMGIESDMDALTDADRTTLMRYIELYKTHREWMHQGRQYRLDTQSQDHLVQQFVATNQQQFLLVSGCLEVPVEETTAPIRLVGLDPNADYEVSLINKDDIDPLATRMFSHPLLQQPSSLMSGAQLMQQGIMPPFPMPDSLWVFYGKQL